MNVLFSQASSYEGNLRRLQFVQVVPGALGLTVPFLVPYWQQHGLTVEGILWLQALFAVTAVVMEVPSGYLADLFGRKWALVTGCLFVALGAGLYLAPGSLLAFCFAEVFFAIGWSMLSGADVALLYDSLQKLDRTAEFSRIQARLHTLSTVSAAVFGVLGGLFWFYSIWLSWLIVVLLLALGAYVSLNLKEVSTANPTASRGVSTSAIKYGFSVFRHDRLLRVVFVVAAVLYAVGQVGFWLNQPNWLAADISPALFGVLFAALNFTAALSTPFVAQLGYRLSVAQKLLLPCVVLAGASFLAASGRTWSVLLVVALLQQVCRSSQAVWVPEILNHRVASEWRATMNSLLTLVGKLFYTTCLLLVGRIVSVHGLSYGYVSIGLLAVLAVLAGTMWFARKRLRE
jgi:hypothetical protein